MSQYKVVIADSRHDDYKAEERVLKSIGAEIVIERSDEKEKIKKLITDTDGLIVNLPQIDREVISVMQKCKCVSRYGVGYDNIDTAALKEKNIFLANVPDYCMEDVSDHAMALFLDCVRKISRKDRLVREGKWNLTAVQPVYRISGKTFGFIGFGNIARTLKRKLSGFQLGRTLVYDPYLTEETAKEHGVEVVELEALLKESDYVSVHAPATPETEGMLAAEQFKMMKNTALLINTSRGPLIDEEALTAALKAGEIAAAGLDVFRTEPLPEDSGLRKLDNIVFTDHAGYYTEESLEELKRKAAENIKSALLNGRPDYPVKL